MSRVRRAVIFSSISQYGARIIGLVTMMIVARLLSPDEVGTFSIASALVLMISEFKMLGAGAYLIREKELNEEVIRRTLGLTIITSWALGGCVLAVGPTISNYYDLPSLSSIFNILSIGFFIGPFVSICIALLTREFNFKIILISNLSSALASLLVTVSLIYLGLSYYSLAWGQVARLTIQFGTLVIFARFALYYQPRFSKLGVIARFGVYNSLANLFRNSVNVVPDIVIGKMGTTSQVGIFSRGIGLMDFVAGTVQKGAEPVVLPYLSEAQRSGKSMVDSYTRATVLATGFAWPVLAVASVASLPVIRFFFGQQWDAAAPLASALAIWLILRTTHNFANNLLITLGKERVMIFKEAGLLIAVFILVIVSYPLSLQAVANAFIIVGFLEIFLVTVLLVRLFGLNVGLFYKSLSSSLLIAALCSFVAWLISMLVPFDQVQSWKPVLLISLILPPIWLILLKCFGHPLYKELSSAIFSFVKSRPFFRFFRGRA
ncbi:oligosaccharide flippase family protein [Marinobacter sp. chi1]|uniref:Oligosaccharide flippase family protein n=1 Tax=Marinobacter suaedae TaxID=3057675 RepID=A0ABT8W2W4_9GAMM|nr:oligosaccharide flippase family protein [Marinobacter sp. chi1]MDO3722583.1 oligosaccharide flippase family protein [Marinobacter sp. chi1]